MGSSKATGSEVNPVIFASGVYNFCEINFSNKVWLEVRLGAKVTIYIDSPARSGSGCPAHTGEVRFSNQVGWLNPAAKASALKFYVWGNPEAGHYTQFRFTNELNSTSPLYADIYAPYSEFVTTNDVNLATNVLAGNISSSNTLTLSSTGTEEGEGVTTYGPSAWTICPPTPSESDPSSGCYH